jgi:hypothetical protein
MNTCTVCNNALTISKRTSDTTINVNDPIDFVKMFIKPRTKKLAENEPNMAMNLNFELNALNTLLNKNGYKDDIKMVIVDKYNLIKKNMIPNSFSLKCNQCNEYFILNPGVIMSIKIKKSVSNNIDNIVEIIEDNTLNRTKDFICPNEKCSVSDKLKEAVIYRPNSSTPDTQYICVNCKTVF